MFHSHIKLITDPEKKKEAVRLLNQITNLVANIDEAHSTRNNGYIRPAMMFDTQKKLNEYRYNLAVFLKIKLH